VTKSLNLSALPSPSVSSQIVIRSAPFGPFGGGSGTRSYTVRDQRSTATRLRPAGLEYWRYWIVQTRPRSSAFTKMGWRPSGSAATRVTVNPSAGTIRLVASDGERPPVAIGGSSAKEGDARVTQASTVSKAARQGGMVGPRRADGLR